jgi:hypothetical protein
MRLKFGMSHVKYDTRVSMSMHLIQCELRVRDPKN